MPLNELELNGIRIISGRVTIPMSGAWVGDVELAEDVPVLVADAPGAALLKLGNVTLIGTVVREGALAGRRAARIVGGYGGWRRTVPAQAYSNPAGVSANMVLSDLGLACGEIVAPETDKVFGEDFVRVSTSASTILRQVVGDSWWIDPLGVTHTIARLPLPPIATDFLIESYDPASGILVASTEDLLSWQPGAIVVGPTLLTPLTLSTVTIVAREDGVVRVEAMVNGVASLGDRMIAALDGIVRSRLANLLLFVPWEYQVANVYDASGWRFDGYALADGAPMPQLAGVQLGAHASVGGKVELPEPGSTLLVQFIGGDPSKPYVCALGSVAPTELHLTTKATEKGTTLELKGESIVGPATVTLEASGAPSIVNVKGPTAVNISADDGSISESALTSIDMTAGASVSIAAPTVTISAGGASFVFNAASIAKLNALP